MKIFRRICTLGFIVLLLGILSANVKPKIMLINSSGAVEKYKVAQEEFKKALPLPIIEVDLNKEQWKLSDIEDILYDEYPDLIYCIGTKAYLIANKFVSEKDIVFSSIINWRRLPLTKITYGVSSELHPGYQVTLYRYIFPKVRKIGVVYSEEYNGQWIRKARQDVAEMGMEVIGEAVDESKFTISTLKALLPEIDALWLISDPVVMPDKKSLLEIFSASDAEKVPVLTYHPAFSEYGAALVVSVDNPTMGRQAAALAEDVLTNVRMKEKVELPAGSHLIINLKKVKRYGIQFNEMALGSVNQIIE